MVGKRSVLLAHLEVNFEIVQQIFDESEFGIRYCQNDTDRINKKIQ